MLAALDEQYRSEGRPPIYFLQPSQPITPRLAKLLTPTRDGLAAQGLSAYFQDRNADAVVLIDAAIALNNAQPDAAAWLSRNRMNRGAALRNLGAFERARKELAETIVEIRQTEDRSATVEGRCQFHLALTEFRLGLADEAKASVSASLRAYGEAPEDSPVSEGLVEQSRQLQAVLEAGKEPPPRVKVDVEAELQRAREQFEAAEKLATLPIDQPTGELMDRMLGPAKQVDEVLKALDEQYRKAGKPEVWFLPLDQPISPHLDELLGPIESDEADAQAE